MDDMLFWPAGELAQGIRDGAFSALELFEAHLRQIAKVNPQLHAVVTVNEEAGRRHAAEADAALARAEIWGPLHGVPFALKDTWETAGMRTTASSPRLREHIPTQDATIAARLKAAGAILYGKTNTPEMALDVQTNSPLFGRASNPFDLARTPGGSTGGGAAAVAAGLSAFEVGSDLGGSIRLPAAYCGLFALKATNRRISMAGHIPPLPGSPSVILRDLISAGPLARSAADLRLLLSLLVGPDRRGVDMPAMPCDPAPERPWSAYRIAWCDEIGIPVEDEIRTPLARLVSDLEILGCTVVRAAPEMFQLNDLLETFGELLGGGLAAVGQKIPLPSPVLKLMARGESGRPMSRGYLNGMAANLREYARSLERRDAAMQELERFFLGDGVRTFDAWLLPVSATPAFKHIPSKGPSGARAVTLDVDEQPVNFFNAVQGYTVPFNITGSPVVVIPISQTPAGLPVGVQLVGPRWSDMRLITLAAQISREVTGGFKKPAGD